MLRRLTLIALIAAGMSVILIDPAFAQCQQAVTYAAAGDSDPCGSAAKLWGSIAAGAGFAVAAGGSMVRGVASFLNPRPYHGTRRLEDQLPHRGRHKSKELNKADRLGRTADAIQSSEDFSKRYSDITRPIFELGGIVIPPGASFGIDYIVRGIGAGWGYWKARK